ncbi:MAG TPA: GNAT family N-acetyltransferase [Aliiroseovarius sp.]|nr:GNAT family N-acetyltransferase [Aliiroseovarius sp.]
MIISAASPHEPGAAALLAASHALMEELFPPEDNFYLGPDALAQPHISFFAAKERDETLGIIALANKGDYGEIKSLFVAPSARGSGLAQRLLAHVEDAARAQSLPLLRLETGDSLTAAIALYARAGFARRAPFGDYPDAPSSIFMEKAL